MARRKSKYNAERGEAGGFVSFYHCVLSSQAVINLSAYGTKLLVDLLSQYKGNNNGDLCAPCSILQQRGWRSKGTLSKAIKELIEAGLIETSRQGGRHQCSLFALSFYAVDECKGKLDIAATSTPKSLWRKHEALPDIATLQKAKQAKDDAKLMSDIMNRAKKQREIKKPAPVAGNTRPDCPHSGEQLACLTAN